MNFEFFSLLLSSLSFILGLSILLYFTYISQPIVLTPSNVSEDFLGKRVKIVGEVTQIVKREKVNYLIISDGRKNFTITIFPNVFKSIEDKVSKNSKVEVTGIITSYRGNLQIILQNPENILIRND